MEAKCAKCGDGIHTEMVSNGVSPDYPWVHNDYKKSWMVDEKGRAHLLHFAKPDVTSVKADKK
jgi:hypothetical protein